MATNQISLKCDTSLMAICYEDLLIPIYAEIGLFYFLTVTKTMASLADVELFTVLKFI